jgi:hypothetical protein
MSDFWREMSLFVKVTPYFSLKTRIAAESLRRLVEDYVKRVLRSVHLDITPHQRAVYRGGSGRAGNVHLCSTFSSI